MQDALPLRPATNSCRKTSRIFPYLVNIGWDADRLPLLLVTSARTNTSDPVRVYVSEGPVNVVFLINFRLVVYHETVLPTEELTVTTSPCRLMLKSGPSASVA